ncbi:MAG: protein-glutamate O-methyltransferase CheR [Nitrospirota bacterium]|nr:protein-glutamate O-methyltransferase CheR [Nitrospirota bacterium]MDH5700496.1 protein-glutamate O-methyltransferase CheR [Nitrospirota bacterium]
MNPEIAFEDVAYIRNLVRVRSAMVLEPEKTYLLKSRLEPFAKQEGFGSMADLVSQLRQTSYGPLHKRVVEAMTINETSFFRDLVPFQALKDRLLPEVIQANWDIKRLHIWCGASSSGQEPYSILLTILHHFPELTSWHIRLIATDLSQEMIKRGQEGRYGPFEVNRGLSPPMLNTYFSRQGMEWQIRDDVRNMIEFREMNLAGSWLVLPTMDLVFIRNVMMYFDMETRKDILRRIRGILAPHGYLILGATETTLAVDDHFERVPVNGTSVYRVRKD